MCFIKAYQIAIVIVVLEGILRYAADAVSLPSCSFTNNDTCGYTLNSPWEVVMGKSEFNPSPTRAIKLLDIGADDEYYALLRASRSSSHMNYTMSSPVIPKGEYKVSFAYSFPASASSLNLETRTVSGISMSVWKDSGRIRNWKLESLRINMTSNFMVIFRSEDVRYGFVALDDIQFCEVCPTLTVYNGTVNYTCNAAEVVCDDGFISNGKNTSVCRSGQWDHMLGCIIKDCGTVPVLTHGHGTSRTTTYQSVATYTCSPGYNLTGNNTIQCLSSGHWSQGHTTCNPVDCSTVPVVAHGHGSSTARTYQSVATYTCDYGYNLTGNKTIQCLSSGHWSQGNTTCNPIDCGTAPTTSHGRVSHSSTKFPYATTYTCEIGYTIRGNNTIQCLSTGHWSVLNASCYKDCSTAPVVAHSRRTSSSTTYQSVATYTCDAGYNLTGNKTIHCMSSGQWSKGHTACNPVDCHAPQSIVHGKVTSHATTYPSSATYSCLPGYKIAGNTKIQCRSNGQWSQVHASCNPVDCHAPHSIADGKVTSQATTYPSNATYSCLPGYKINGDTKIQCQSNGQWSQANASCNPVDCKTVPVVTNGRGTSTSTAYQSVASYTCSPGYTLSGNKTIQCLSSGQWSQGNTSCTPVDCHAAPNITHGHVTSNATTFPSSITYTCDPGYSLSGNSTVHCLTTGKWSPVRASCNPVDCNTAPTLTHGHVTPNATTFPSSKTYTCDPGYSISGNSTIQCLSSGHWSPVRASCNPVDCNAPSTIDHGNVNPQNTTYHSVASYTCDSGYNIVGNSTIQCMSNGKWSRTHATCKPVDCGAAPAIDHGNMSSLRTTYLSVATYTCENGYNISGNNTIHCMSNGTWSSVMATCSPVDCGAAPAIDHGNVPSVETIYSSVATYTCENGYNISGNNTIQCMSNGTWSSVMATCSPVDCGAAPGIDHGNVSSVETTYSSVATYTCENGYNISENNTIHCMSNGTWSSVMATCSPVATTPASTEIPTATSTILSSTLPVTTATTGVSKHRSTTSAIYNQSTISHISTKATHKTTRPMSEKSSSNTMNASQMAIHTTTTPVVQSTTKSTTVKTQQTTSLTPGQFTSTMISKQPNSTSTYVSQSTSGLPTTASSTKSALPSSGTTSTTIISSTSQTLISSTASSSASEHTPVTVSEITNDHTYSTLQTQTSTDSNTVSSSNRHSQPSSSHSTEEQSTNHGNGPTTIQLQTTEFASNTVSYTTDASVTTENLGNTGDTKKQTGSNTAVIIGSVAGVLVAFIAVLVIVYVWMRFKNRRIDQMNYPTDDGNEATFVTEGERKSQNLRLEEINAQSAAEYAAMTMQPTAVGDPTSRISNRSFEHI